MGFRTDACCCFSLRTGTLILGYLSIIASILASILCIIVLANIDRILEVLADQDVNITNVSLVSHEKQNEYSFAGFVTVFASTLILSLFQAILSVFLILGVYKEKEKYIKINVYVWVAFIIMDALSGLSQVIYYMASGNFAQAWSAVVAAAIVICLSAYFTAVIHSYRMELIERKRQEIDSMDLTKNIYIDSK